MSKVPGELARMASINVVIMKWWQAFTRVGLLVNLYSVT